MMKKSSTPMTRAAVIRMRDELRQDLSDFWKGIEIAVMTSDVERAIELILNPEVITPCIDQCDSH